MVDAGLDVLCPCAEHGSIFALQRPTQGQSVTPTQAGPTYNPYHRGVAMSKATKTPSREQLAREQSTAYEMEQRQLRLEFYQRQARVKKKPPKVRTRRRRPREG